MRHIRTAAWLLAATMLVSATGCAATKDAVKTTVTQGIETTSTGQHNTVPANQAQDAVDAANGAIQQVPAGEPVQP
jgi:hypothetical protein